MNLGSLSNYVNSIKFIYVLQDSPVSMSSRVIAVPKEAYEQLADVTGRISVVTRKQSSLSFGAGLSISVMSTFMQKVMRRADSDPGYREELARAIESNSRERIVNLLMRGIEPSD